MTGPRPSLSDELDQAFGGDADAEPRPTAFLVGLSGKHAGKLFRIKPGQSLIGRTSKALVTLDEKAVSHQHARLTLTADGCTVTDLESTNGSFLNDQPLTEPQELRAGDVLRFGNSTLGFLTDAEDEEQHTRALAKVTGSAVMLGGATANAPLPQSAALPQVVPANSQDVAVGQPPAAVITAPAPPKPSALDNALDKMALAGTYLKRYWKLLAVCGVIGGIAGAATITFKPPLAKAEFEISLREEETESTARHFATRSIEYFAEAEKNFVNISVVRQTMEDMGMGTPIDHVKGTAAGLSLQKEGLRSYRGSYSHPDSKFAERFLAQHLQNFLEREIGKSIRVLRSEVDLLRTQYENNEALLKEHEASLRDFKEEHVEALPENADGQMRSRATLLMMRDDLSASLSRYKQELALAKKQLASEDALEITKVARSQPYETRLARVKTEIAEARAKGFKDGHPQLKQLLGEEAELKRLRDSAVGAEATDTDRRVNAEHRRLANLVGELTIKVNDAGQQLGQTTKRLEEIGELAGEMPVVEQQIAGRARAVKASKLLHERLFEQLKAKELELEFERASVAARYEVLEAPSAYAVQPTSTAIKRGGAGVVGGIFLGILIAALHWLRVYARERNVRIERDEVNVQRQLAG